MRGGLREIGLLQASEMRVPFTGYQLFRPAWNLYGRLCCCNACSAPSITLALFKSFEEGCTSRKDLVFLSVSTVEKKENR